VSHVTGWSRGLQVSGGGQGVVSHAGLALLRHLSDRTGLTEGLSGRWRMRGCWAMTGAGCWRTWRARSATVPG
jgi:hypothetical protein